MSVTVPNVNPALAKVLDNGNLLCQICSAQVKRNVWIAHSNGRKHRENIALFKSRYLTAQTNALKRPPEQPSTSTPTPVKKPKVDMKESTSEHTNGSAPWEKGSLSKMMESTKHVQKKNVIEGVPEGFFEDERLNKRVVETIEKQASMEQEYANFMRELDEAKLVEEQREDNEEHVVAIEHDIELIDEQIDQWKRVNRLELRRDELYSTADTGGKQRKQVDEGMSDDEDADVDLTGWRSKGI